MRTDAGRGPGIEQQVEAMAADVDCDPKVLLRVVEYDSQLADRILHSINTAYFGRNHHICSLKEALTFIGFNTVKNNALSLLINGGRA